MNDWFGRDPALVLRRPQSTTCFPRHDIAAVSAYGSSPPYRSVVAQCGTRRRVPDEDHAMADRKAETLYLSGRVSDSLAMAAAAVDPCAKIVHLALAKLYGQAIDTLVAQPQRPAFRAVFANAAVAERRTPDRRVDCRQAIPLRCESADVERQLASARLS